MYDKAKFLRYMKTDMFLKMLWEKRKKETPKEHHDSYLHAMFNSYVADNSVAMRAWHEIETPKEEQP